MSSPTTPPVIAPRPTVDVNTTAAAAVPTNSTRPSRQAGQIMGIGIGSEMEEARAKLDPLREGEEGAPAGEKEGGERVYWKLNGTEYSWIIAWADDEGKITRLRAMLRPEQAKPFSEIGDLAAAAINEPNMAVWNLKTTGEWPYRVVAQGPERRATTIYMFSLQSDAERD